MYKAVVSVRGYLRDRVDPFYRVVRYKDLDDDDDDIAVARSRKCILSSLSKSRYQFPGTRTMLIGECSRYLKIYGGPQISISVARKFCTSRREKPPSSIELLSFAKLFQG